MTTTIDSAPSRPKPIPVPELEIVEDQRDDTEEVADQSTSSRFAWMALAMAVGVLLVAMAYAQGRSGSTSSPKLFYWCGLLLVIAAPTALLLFSKRVKYWEAVGVALAVSMATYAIKECYSPLQWTFSDEFQHQITAQSIVNSHHLFQPNNALPSSPYYPALEIVTTTVSTLSHLSLYASSVIVLGTLHVLAAVALFYLSYLILPDLRIAALSVVIYATGGDFLFFTSYFAYQSMGLPLCIITLLCFTKLLKASSTRQAFAWAALTAIFGATTVASHHVSSYLTLVFALCLLLTLFRRHPGNHIRWLSVVTMTILAGFTAVWSLVIAHPTTAYLSQSFSGLLGRTQQSVHVSTHLIKITGTSFLSGHIVRAPAPKVDTLLEYSWVGLIAVLLVLGFVTVWRHRSTSNPLIWGWALAGLSVFVAVAVRAISTSGGELATRVLAFALIPGCLFCAIAVDALNRLPSHLKGRGQHSRPQAVSWIVTLLCVAAVTFLEPGGLAAGWPPFYARIPGPYIVAGRMRSVDSYNLASAVWAGSHLPAGSQLASDRTNDQLMRALGHLIPNGSPDVTALFITSTIDRGLFKAVAKLGIRYVVVDSRIGSSVPVNQQPVFLDDPFAGHYLTPIPQASLDKFGSLPGVSRVYSSGPIAIYDISGYLHGT